MSYSRRLFSHYCHQQISHGETQQWFPSSADSWFCLSPRTVKMNPEQSIILLSHTCLPPSWRQDGIPTWELQCLVNSSTFKKNLPIVLARGRSLTVKNVTRAVWNARDLAPRTAPCAPPAWCCLWMTTVAYPAVMSPIPPMPRTAVTAGTPQVSGEERKPAEEGPVSGRG